MMVVVISQQEIHENRARRVSMGVNNQRRIIRGREIPSRYMSPASSTTSSTTTATTSTSNSSATATSSGSSSLGRRFPSPFVSRRDVVTTNSTPSRSQSVGRRRSVTPRPVSSVANGGEVTAATKLLVTSTRSLSVSFQGEAFSLPICKAKAVNSSNGARKATPERRRGTPVRGRLDGGANDEHGDCLKSADSQKRWPGRTREVNPVVKSLDCSILEKNESLGSGRMDMRLLRDSFEESGRASFDGMLNLEQGNLDLLSGIGVDANSMIESSAPSDLTASDTESVSSGSSSGARVSNSQRLSGPGGIMVSAKFWQETNMRLRRLQDSGSTLSGSPLQKMAAPPKLNLGRKFGDGPVMSPRAMSSPTRGAIRPASPGTLMTPLTPSSSRGSSPSKVRSLVANSWNGALCDTPSVLSYAVDIRRGRVGENRIVDAHQLRLLYNRHLQWRFVNARAEAAFLVQRQSAEKNLWNALIAMTSLRDSVRHKRTQLQLLKQKLKLAAILRGQMTYLEEWSHLDTENSTSLRGAIEALKASTLRLPVVGGAIADIQGLKETVHSAIDVMDVTASSICLLLAKVEEVNTIVAELAKTAAREQALLEHCKDILSSLTATQVKHCSLRTHILQLNRFPTP
ncbi:QWRF motif-containing protein [Drosera capensis]